MNYKISNRIYGRFYYSVCKNGLKGNPGSKKILAEYRRICLRAKDIGSKNRLLSAYMMAAYFIAMNRCTGLTAEENYAVFEKGLRNSRLFAVILGNADQYLDIKKMPSRKAWAESSKNSTYENDWVVEVYESCEAYEYGCDYIECGVCKLCKDEKCFELAKYLCRLDFLMAEIMGMKLVRTKTLAEGYDCCDFRYSHK